MQINLEERERSTIEAILKNLIKKNLTAAQLTQNKLINIILHGEKRHDKSMSKVARIISKLVSD